MSELRKFLISSWVTPLQFAAFLSIYIYIDSASISTSLHHQLYPYFFLLFLYISVSCTIFYLFLLSTFGPSTQSFFFSGSTFSWYITISGPFDTPLWSILIRSQYASHSLSIYSFSFSLDVFGFRVYYHIFCFLLVF